MTDNKVASVGTGQQGSGSAGGNWEKNSHAASHVNEEKTTEDKINEVADDAAIKGMERQRRDDPTIFTK